MEHLDIFNPRDNRYKTPYGAVPSGTTVQFTLHPQRRLGFSHAVITARFEGLENKTVTYPLPWTESQCERDLFSGALPTGDYVGLVWYTATLTGLDGRSMTLGEYQLTVYEGTETVPAWFGEGMCYQIFPDRFFRSRIPDPTGMVGGRRVHQDWNELPDYRPDETGEIRNRDFFGGDLPGVMEKLDYLQGLGVETLYFCPIFEAAENHRYGTADYTQVDPMLGTNEDFSRLCDEAHRRGIRVILDGVFNHTGFVSRYFNGDGFYPGPGAYQSQKSPYFSWFQFTKWPKRYESWWGIYSLPAVNEKSESYRRYLYEGRDSVVRRWLRAGADGWRLDVADELSDELIQGIHAAARAEKPDAVVIGEVWEDGTTKIAYQTRRKHLLGGHCDGLMNYPLRNAILDYFLGGKAEAFVAQMETIRENYPPFAFYSAMNALGTHDTLRILTLLGLESEAKHETRGWRAQYRLSPYQRRHGKERLMAAALLLFAFPGAPTVYYGDEIGIEGFEDPFNRRTYPWGEEDLELLWWFTQLGRLRKAHPALRRGSIRYVAGEGHLLAFIREMEEQRLLAAFNSGERERTLSLECCHATPSILLGNPGVTQEENTLLLRLHPRSGILIQLYTPTDSLERHPSFVNNS